MFSTTFFAQTNPAITSWKINKTGATGFGGYKTNVQQVQYSDKNVYISTTDIADWTTIGYNWPNNPWLPKAQNYVFKITLNPIEKTGLKTIAPYGHIGVWTNGVSIYNPKDAKTWKDSLTWFQNAYYFEHTNLQTFDPCYGHPNGNFEYHLHVNPYCLYDSKDSSKHAPIIGYAFDGFPIYGAYGYENTNGTGKIKRMKPSYRLRNITDRSTLPNGQVLKTSLQGPSLKQYPLGAYCEDYEFVKNSGDLDEYNGRICKTPEYPNGTYAYFVTIDNKYLPVYPYIIGPTYYGFVQMGNLGPNGGFNTINETVKVYTTASNDLENPINFKLYPNPASDELNLFLIPSFESNLTMTIYNAMGEVVLLQKNIQTAVNYSFDIKNLSNGVYFVRVANDKAASTSRILISSQK